MTASFSRRCHRLVHEVQRAGRLARGGADAAGELGEVMTAILNPTLPIT